MSIAESAATPDAISPVIAAAIESMAEALYEHWRSSDYELKRQPVYADATPTLRRVFADQAKVLVPVVQSIIKNSITVTLAPTVREPHTEPDLIVSVNPREVVSVPKDDVIDPATDELLDSAEWAKIFDVTVMDPDGWDRTDYDNSWGEKITRAEFKERLSTSTYAHNAALRAAGWNV